ncbi:hypothetical protein [Vibrio aestuarianus]|uniref:hypothetical protein n=1 Tax=Vibrio aestuarianus TaxID=28171 RepID=UPI00237CB378|nr:hypothetical protein [Vibrio aestuarianus]MDE1341063.1 hypothetical protein [Vibrio aestuarianus]
MTRECKSDFDSFLSYIASYKISENLEQTSYVETAKSMHKAYFSLLHFHCELNFQRELFRGEYSDDENILSRISEVVSDIGSSNFNWINGSYKASRVMLRSSIENFVRGLSSIENETQLTEKSVYSLFDNAKESNIFNSNETVRLCFNSIHSSYKELCKDTHTASIANMENISSLVDYPKYFEDKSRDTGAIFVSVVKDILIMLCLIFNKVFHKMHHKNQQNILISIPRNTKPLILAP